MAPSIFLVILTLLAIASIGFTIWAVIEIASKPFVNEKNKVLWLIIVLMLGLLGPIIYLTQRKKLLAKYADNSNYDTLDLNAPQAMPQMREKNWDDDYV